MQQATTNNTVVVTSQPVSQVHTVYHSGNSEYALPAIIFAVAITVCFLSLGCWYAIICSGIGIALAAAVSSNTQRLLSQWV
jgi:ascorbate-specific PTS system EIIC-type component UlaA